MSWLLIVTIAYLLNAFATVVGKFLLTQKNPQPVVYAFYINVLGLLALILIPFGFQMASASQIALALLAGLIFTFAILYMFGALSQNEASRIAPFIGGLQPIFILALAWFFLGETLNSSTLLGFAVIVIGTIMISWNKDKADRQSYVMALVATILFAISYTVSKYTFIEQGFIAGFVWSRVGAFMGALFFIIWPSQRKIIFKEIKDPKTDTGGLFVLGQASGAISAFLVYYAIAISASVAVVSATRGLEYVFLLIMTVMLSKKVPTLLKENISPKILTQKTVAIVLIIMGLIIIAT